MFEIEDEHGDLVWSAQGQELAEYVQQILQATQLAGQPFPIPIPRLRSVEPHLGHAFVPELRALLRYDAARPGFDDACVMGRMRSRCAPRARPDRGRGGPCSMW